MNEVILTNGRLTREPDIRYSQGENPMAVARYTLAVNRDFTPRDNSQQSADFISCVAFGKAAEWVEKYCHKGTKLNVIGRIQTGSYTNKDGQKVYTTEVYVSRHEFGESKKATEEEAPAAPAAPAQTTRPAPTQAAPIEEFVNIPDDVDDEELPFN